ncbi:MAG: hypothetical protein GX986_04615 [Firmicutes bacterium]|nr:hypothetical protein [Bacillota bacterium]
MGEFIMFDYWSLAKKYEVAPEMVERLLSQARQEFGSDGMMIELHMIRALRMLGRDKKRIGWRDDWNH